MKTSLQIPLVHSDHNPTDSEFIPYWARCQTQFAKNLLELSPEPIEYDFHDDDGWENCFFFPEDCTRAPVLELESYESDSADENSIDASDKASLSSISDAEPDSADNMTPALPDIRMLDTEALSDLLEDNLCPPEITSILIFATNGAIFAYASDLSTRQLRNLSATYGAAYTSFARTASTGNLTGVKHASQPSSYMTAPSVSLGDVGSIVFENENQVAVVTKIADKVLLAAVGPEKLHTSDLHPHIADTSVSQESAAAAVAEETAQVTPQEASQATRPTTVSSSSVTSGAQQNGDGLLAKQYQIDREHDLARLAALNLNTSPEILLALESKSAALGRFLRQKLQDLESPEDF